jgi:hypothetical protein
VRAIEAAVMKKTNFLLLTLWLGITLAGCAAVSIPKDSKPLGVYKGVLRGNVYDGPIWVELFQTPDGKTIFTGRFVNTLYDGEYYFRGTVTDHSMEGDISLGFGTIAGELSQDGTRMSGVFRLAQNHGTWSAGLQ